MLKKFFFFSFFIVFLFASKPFCKNFYKYDQYFHEASKQFNIPFLLLKSIALTENYQFNIYIKKRNKNKTYDYGLMQINSIWLKRFGLKEKNLFNPRTNIFSAAYILRKLINKYGYSWDTIGMYHSSTKLYKIRWLKKLKENLLYIIKYDKKYKYRKEYEYAFDSK